MTPEQREQAASLLQQGKDLAPEWARILFPPEKREYELVYHGKEREENIIADTLAVPLQAVRTFGENGVDWHNMLIFGDNLQVMKSLLEMKKAGKLCNADGTPGVRLVYIDPPFATKKDFVGTEDQRAYQDKIVGSSFIEFIRKRLVFIREILCEEGSVFVHLDCKKGHYIKTIMDEVFGEHNFINEIIWHYRKWSTNTKSFQKNHDTIFWYSKKAASKIRKFEVVAYEKPSQGTLRRWKGKKQLATFDEHGRRTATDTNDESTGAPISDVWTDIHSPENMQLLKISIINPAAVERVGYPTQKPEALIDRVIRSVTKEGDLIFDAFAGSGTTCAVAEKLNRRWIGIDCGKLSVYTIQKRMLNLCKEIGNKGPKLVPKPFTLFNAGLYDFSRLRTLPWDAWRFFALQLFQCRDEPHLVGGIAFDGFRQGADVMIFNHFEHKDAAISEETIQELHGAVGSRVGSKVFIIAPALTFDFQQDYIEHNGVRYYALRIPYSIIHELHRREFTALKQPVDEMAVNDTVEAVGFDFIRTPELDYKLGKMKPKGELFEKAFIEIKTFRSDAAVREPFKKKGNRETLSMVMLDFDYDEERQVFDLDEVQYVGAIEKAGWKVVFRPEALGKKMMAVLLDIYGNEARILIDTDEFGLIKKQTVAKKKTAKKGARK